MTDLAFSDVGFEASPLAGFFQLDSEEVFFRAGQTTFVACGQLRITINPCNLAKPPEPRGDDSAVDHRVIFSPRPNRCWFARWELTPVERKSGVEIHTLDPHDQLNLIGLAPGEYRLRPEPTAVRLCQLVRDNDLEGLTELFTQWLEEYLHRHPCDLTTSTSRAGIVCFLLRSVLPFVVPSEPDREAILSRAIAATELSDETSNDVALLLLVAIGWSLRDTVLERRLLRSSKSRAGQPGFALPPPFSRIDATKLLKLSSQGLDDLNMLYPMLGHLDAMRTWAVRYRGEIAGLLRTTAQQVTRSIECARQELRALGADRFARSRLGEWLEAELGFPSTLAAIDESRHPEHSSALPTVSPSVGDKSVLETLVSNPRLWVNELAARCQMLGLTRGLTARTIFLAIAEARHRWESLRLATLETSFSSWTTDDATAFESEQQRMLRLKLEDELWNKLLRDRPKARWQERDMDSWYFEVRSLHRYGARTIDEILYLLPLSRRDLDKIIAFLKESLAGSPLTTAVAPCLE
ncbi:MAG TPA: hypothetical protein VHC22_24055 [Pirellulales bacterium]|nr:hypothetical protein [Pirellulales bacterium]